MVGVFTGLQDITKLNFMKCVILYQDQCQPISEAVGFQLPYKAYIVEGAVTTDEFESAATVPFAASANQTRTAIVAQVIQAAAGRGKTVQSADCTVIGSVS